MKKYLLLALLIVLFVAGSAIPQGTQYLACDLPAAEDAPITATVIEIDGVEFAGLVAPQADHFRLYDVTAVLIDYEEHTFRAKWSNANGESDWSATLTYQLPPPTPTPGQPQNLRMLES